MGIHEPRQNDFTFGIYHFCILSQTDFLSDLMSSPYCYDAPLVSSYAPAGDYSQVTHGRPGAGTRCTVTRDLSGKGNNLRRIFNQQIGMNQLFSGIHQASPAFV
jgi:hypothetical protein